MITYDLSKSITKFQALGKCDPNDTQINQPLSCERNRSRPKEAGQAHFSRPEKDVVEPYIRKSALLMWEK